MSQFPKGFTSLNLGQQLAYIGAQQGKSMLITGGGGVGKSHLIRFMADHIENLVLTASTGIAGVNIEGQTINSFMGFNAKTTSVYEARKFNDDVREKLNAVAAILIDELSMIRADTLDLIDERLKEARNNNKPFGGVQMILVGDFCQITPVVSNSEDDQKFKKTYNGRTFAFESDIWEEGDFEPYVLSEYVRQGDEATRRVMRNMRMGHKLQDAVDFINNNAKGIVDSDALCICKTNSKAAAINQKRYAALTTTERVSRGIIKGDFPNSAAPTQVDLKLKCDSKVMMCANNPDEGYLNGDIGRIMAINNKYIKIQLDRGPIVNVTPYTWENYAYQVKDGELGKHSAGEFTQFPVKLSYAITAHKSQGMTLDAAIVDLSGGFNSEGLTYVVISRVRSLDNLKLVTPLKVSDIKVSQKAKNFTFNVSMAGLKKLESTKAINVNKESIAA